MSNSTFAITNILPTPSFFNATLNAAQTTNLGVTGTDHITFNSAVGSGGSDISLDTSSPYSVTAGTASVGRFTLSSGRTFKLQFNPVAITFSCNSLISKYDSSILLFPTIYF